MSVASPNAQRDPWEDELDLRELLRIIVKRRGLITGLVAASVAVAALFSFWILPEVFESEAAMQLPAGSPELGGEYSLEALAAMGTSPQLLTRVAGRVPGADPARLSRAISVSLDNQARLLRVRAEAGTAVGAHDLLTAWAQEFVAAVSASLVQAAGERLALAEAELATRRAELDTARDALHEFQAAHSISLLQTELERLEAELLRAQERIRELELYTLPADRERLAYLQEELARQPRTLDVDGAAVFAGPVGPDATVIGPVGALVNPTYLSLHQDLVETEERLTANTALLDGLRNFAEEAPERIQALRAELAVLNAEAERLEGEVQLALLRYEAAAEQHTKALQAVAARRSEAPRLVSEPTLPTSPVRPRKMLNIALAAFLAAFVGVGITFILEIWQSPDPEERAVRS